MESIRNERAESRDDLKRMTRVVEGTRMDGMLKSLVKRLLLLSACSAGVMILFALGSSRGILSPRGLGIALAILCIAIAIGTVLIIKKSAKELRVTPGPPGSSTDAVTRNRLLWRLRMAKTTIVIMGVALVAGLTQIKNSPILPLLVGLIMNLLITAKSVQTVVRLKKILN
jgi:hypothetical protein